MSMWKDAQYYMSLGICKLKQQWDFTTHPLEWAKFRTMTTSNVGKYVEKQKLSFIADGYRQEKSFNTPFCNTDMKYHLWESREVKSKGRSDSGKENKLTMEEPKKELKWEGRCEGKSELRLEGADRDKTGKLEEYSVGS